MRSKRRRSRGPVNGGFFRFETEDRRAIFGTGDGDFIRLRDEFGNTWLGRADQLGETLTRYYFRDAEGNSVSGISDNSGILLRDQNGKSWRGYIV